MHFASSGAIGGVGILAVLVAAQTDSSRSVADLSPPELFLTLPRHTLAAGGVVRAESFGNDVLCAGRRPQVLQPIVEFVAVDVVYLGNRPTSGRDEPRDPVSLIAAPTNCYLTIAISC